MAFDGEDVPTAAESVGGPAPAAADFHIPDRELLRRINEMENNEIQRAEIMNDDAVVNSRPLQMPDFHWSSPLGSNSTLRLHQTNGDPHAVQMHQQRSHLFQRMQIARSVGDFAQRIPIGPARFITLQARLPPLQAEVLPSLQPHPQEPLHQADIAPLWTNNEIIDLTSEDVMHGIW